MCRECYQLRCPSSCPNASAASIGRCACCGDPIGEEEARLRESGGALYHIECLEALSLTELLELFGIDVREE